MQTKTVHKRSIAYDLIAKGFVPQIKNNHKSKSEKFVFVFEADEEFLKEFDNTMNKHEEAKQKESLYY